MVDTREETIERVIESLETLTEDIETQDISRSEMRAWILKDLELLKSISSRCQHGMFYSGAGACPECG